RPLSHTLFPYTTLFRSVSGAYSTNAAQFTGRENDGTGLYFYRARFYSPALQRFTAGDPLGLSAGVNLYAYVLNRPTVLVDPSGRDRKSTRLNSSHRTIS